MMEVTTNGENDDDSISHYYNEDFESDSDESVVRKKEHNILKTTKKVNSLARSFSDTQAALSRRKAKRSSFDRPLPPKRNSNQNEESYVTQRLLSARKHKITELRNEIKNMERQLKEVSDENRLLKRLHVRQEKELMKLDMAKSELPDIMRSHKQELQALRKQLRRQKEKNREILEQMKAKEVEILRLKGDLKVLNHVCKQKDLMEREDLQKKVESLEKQLSYQTTTSQEYARKLDLANKIRKQEMATEKARFRQTKDMVDQLQYRCEELNVLLKDKELKLERNFIYSKRDRNPLKVTKSVSVETVTPESQEKSELLLSLPVKPMEVSDSFNAAEEQHSSAVDSDYDCIINTQNDDCWPQITQGEQHEEISLGEQMLHDTSKQQSPNSILTTDDREIASGDMEKDNPLFPTKSPSADSLGSIRTLTTVGNRSYSSLALTSSNQNDQYLSKENVILHHSSCSKPISLFSQDTVNHNRGDAVDLEDNLIHLRSSFHRKSTIHSGHSLYKQNEINEQLPPASSLENKTYTSTNDSAINSDSSPYQSSPNERRDNNNSSWLPDIFEQSVNLH